MPELPEVETVRTGLQQFLPGRVITAITHDSPKAFPNDAQAIQQHAIGAQVVAVRRRAKVLIIDLSTNYSFIVHLKMTGQLVFRGNAEAFGAGHPNKSLVGTLPDKTTRVVITFTDKSALFFNDQRKFGWMRFLPTAEITQTDFFKKVGPEPLDVTFTPQLLAERLARRPRTTIKAALLDQTVLAGIGNIYADEALWMARIHPLTLVSDVSFKHIRELHKSIQSVLRLSIQKGGSTDKNYVNAEGKMGSYLGFAHVFRRQGAPCTRCGATIIKTKVAGRGTHICLQCQPILTSSGSAVKTKVKV